MITDSTKLLKLLTALGEVQAPYLHEHRPSADGKLRHRVWCEAGVDLAVASSIATDLGLTLRLDAGCAHFICPTAEAAAEAVAV